MIWRRLLVDGLPDWHRDVIGTISVKDHFAGASRVEEHVVVGDWDQLGRGPGVAARLCCKALPSSESGSFGAGFGPANVEPLAYFQRGSDLSSTPVMDGEALDHKLLLEKIDLF
jgi:hypothetical protein